MIKQLYIFSLLFCFSHCVIAQQISGKAFYTAMMTVEKPKLTPKQMENPQMRELAAQLEKPFTDEFVLEFTQDESEFRKLPKLEKPDPKKGKISISMSVMGDEEVLYKNIREDRYLNEKELYNKKFLIDDKLEVRKWELSKETKSIGDYVCFKATYVPPGEDTPRLRSGTDGKDKEIIAWYTPQIPIKNGPAEYDGLPGLILEVHEGRKKFVCTKIVINPQEPIAILPPSKGKRVDQEEFDAILKKKSTEMMENFKTGKRRD